MRPALHGRMGRAIRTIRGCGYSLKKLDDCFGQFLVRVSCVCGASRHIEPEALARLVGWRHTFASLGRTAGESAFNVARMMGHAKSTSRRSGLRALDAVRYGERRGEHDRSSARSVAATARDRGRSAGR
jgi:hypothetical protein